MTVTTTDFELFMEAHPVDAIPCDWTEAGFEDECAEASWSSQMIPHCPGDSGHNLVCEGCRDYVLGDGILECYVCQAELSARDVLISIERLGAK